MPDPQFAEFEKSSFNKLLLKAGYRITAGEYMKVKGMERTILGGIVAAGLVVLLVLAGEGGMMLLGVLPPAAFACIFGSIFFSPFIKAALRREKIDQDLPQLITYMGGISTSKASRDDLFKNVALREDIFGVAAQEIKRVRVIAINWNFGYIYATKLVSVTTASRIFGDFLGRFSQALDSGESLQDFFAKEQTSILDTFVMNYRRGLKTLESMNDAFVALSTSLTFISINFLIMMYLFGDELSNTQLLITITLIVNMVYAFLVLAYKVTTPPDPLVHLNKLFPVPEYKSMHLAGVACFGVGTAGVFLVSVILALPVPVMMTILGIVYIPIIKQVKQYEELIKRRDENFPVFIRTLGGTSEAMGGSIFESVKTLTSQQFGPISDQLKLASSQYEFGLEPSVIWEQFSLRTQSAMINKYMKLFTESMIMGGSPAKISIFISNVTERVLSLRKDKEQVLATQRGMMLPLTAINVGLLVFMKTTLFLLGRVMAVIPSQFAFGQPPIEGVIGVYFDVFYLTTPLFAVLSMWAPEQTTRWGLFKYLSIYFLVIGLEIILVDVMSQAILDSFGIFLNLTG